MHRSQANRSVISARILGGSLRPTRPTPSTRPGMNLLLRAPAVSPPLVAIRTRKHRTVGGPSVEWASTPYLKPTSAAMTAAWSLTVSDLSHTR